jgi:hypothetical protein
LLDLVEEPFDQVACAIKIGLKQIGSLQLRFGGMFAHTPSGGQAQIGNIGQPELPRFPRNGHAADMPKSARMT